MGELTNQQTIERLKDAINSGDFMAMAAIADQVYAPDVVQEWPQSGERITGLANLRGVNDNYPAMTGTQPNANLRRVTGAGDTWVAESTIDYGNGVPVSWVAILEFRDGKIVKETDYFADPFEPPAWRAQWVQKMEPVTPEN